jgi:hypothetical protein
MHFILMRLPLTVILSTAGEVGRGDSAGMYENYWCVCYSIRVSYLFAGNFAHYIFDMRSHILECIEDAQIG